MIQASLSLKYKCRLQQKLLVKKDKEIRHNDNRAKNVHHYLDIFLLVSAFSVCHFYIPSGMEFLKEFYIIFYPMTGDRKLCKGENDFARLCNICNKWVVRDTSKKIKVVLCSKSMRGKLIKSLPMVI